MSCYCVKTTKNSTQKYLIQQRLKYPYFGFYGVVTGKIKWGETLEETVRRESFEETGLTGTINLNAIKHKMDYDQNNNLLEDKIFFLCLIENCQEKLKSTFEGGRNVWMSRSQIEKLDNIFPELMLGVELITKDHISFNEKNTRSTKIDTYKIPSFAKLK